MESLTHLDTHVVVWLYAGEMGRFGTETLRILEQQPLVISPMVELELEYLFEIKRISACGRVVVQELINILDLKVSACAFQKVISAATAITWTRDPFDRIITAQAQQEKAVLLTADTQIQENYKKAVWG